MEIVNVWIISNLLLWIAYKIQNPTLADFGKITNRNLQIYMLSFATLAYIANFIHVYMLRNNENKNMIYFSIIAFYFIQIFFIPAVRSKNAKFNVKFILLLACLPMYQLATISLRRKDTTEIFLSVFVLFHVFINDFLLYGHLF